MDSVFNKALEAAAFAPLLPVIERVKAKDMPGAVALVMSSTGVLKLVSKFDKELPRDVLKKVLTKQEVTDAIELCKSKMPTPELQEPFKKLQDFCQNLDADVDTLLQQADDVFTCFKSCADALAKKSFKFPQDILKQVDPEEVLQALASKIPAPMDVTLLNAVSTATGNLV